MSTAEFVGTIVDQMLDGTVTAEIFAATKMSEKCREAIIDTFFYGLAEKNAEEGWA